MDSEVVTKLNETEDKIKENVSTEAVDKAGTDSSITKDQSNEKAEDVTSAEDETGLSESKTTTTIVVTKNDNGEEAPITETKTTTTVVVTNKNNENDSTQTETKTTTTVVVTKNENEGESSDKEAEKTTTEIDEDTTNTETNDSNKTVEDENEKLSSDKLTSSETTDVPDKTDSQAAVPDTSTDAPEQNVSVSEENDEESEESETLSDDEDQETKEKIHEIDNDQGQANISDDPEVAAEIKKPEDVDDKVNKPNKDINNQIENIISDIDINIKAQEKIAQLKEQELQLIQKQKELANQIQQQQILAQKLIAQNQLKEQELQAQQALQAQQLLQFQSQSEPKEVAVPRVYQDHTNIYNQQEDLNETQESSNIKRTVDLRKIFTPATDAPQILPKNRKLYASSAFYSPTLHPTVEDQVELARRISHSLSDISNHTSKGQSMYVNRKKRSVKWVHEGCGQEIGEDDIIETQSLYKENADANSKPELTKLEKMPLKLVMNPRGQMRDYNSLKESINIETGLLSPDNCAELITALQLHKGRGAELFAKRRRKSENWVIDETNAGTHSPSGIPDYQQYQARPATSPSILPAYSDAGKHRVQLNLHQDQLIDKYSKSGVQVVKSPWEAALQTGSASTAFLDNSKYRSQTPIASIPSPVNFNQDVTDYPGSNSELTSRPPASYNTSINNAQDLYKNQYDSRAQSQPIQPVNPQRELAYKPSVAQGWGGQNVELPREYYWQGQDQEYENPNTDFMSEYYCAVNEHAPVEAMASGINPHINLTDIKNPYICGEPNLSLSKESSVLNFNEEVQFRLQQLETFQQCFMQQQRLGLNTDYKSIMPVASGQPNVSMDKYKSSNTIPKSSHIIKATSSNSKVSVREEDKTENNVENTELVNVRELISSFEQQSLKECDVPKKNRSDITDKQRLVLENETNQIGESQKNQIDESTVKGLYVPKEISLASYAPPPALQRNQQPTYNYQDSQKVDLSKGYQSPIDSGARNGFPISNPTTGLYSSVPPKQQLYAPASYQKIPPSSENAAPQVNFNPSPLSFDKLSKFQAADQRNSGVPNQRYLNVNKQPAYRGIQNSSPIPFGSGGVNDYASFDNVQRSPISSTFAKPSSPQQSRYGQNTYSTGSNQTRVQGEPFNNCARGWSTGSNPQRNAFCPRVPTAAESLPYSDF